MSRSPITFTIPPDAVEKPCSSCGKPVVFITTPKGKWMPLSVSLAERNVLGERVAPSHFSDCPNAQQHRRPR